MSAADALTQARAAGVMVAVDGDDLVLAADAPPAAEVLNLIARNKADIVALLRAENGGWLADDWREYFAERAGIAEYDGGLLRDQAEAQAFFCCVSLWLERHPVRSVPTQCAYCMRPRAPLLPYLTDCSLINPGHTWIHQECSQRWHQERRQKAVAALVAMGIAVPFKFTDDFGKNGSA